ncbi:hypothetical protein [Thermoflavimicrobium daqui]|uniref:Uncharacterized protein n=1 Tax=Thermoflavimicrobium daqui TaxID=2137476 RepID=A0A364K9V2_9BACL|nr:hypothetical protein [Thermoflavimicrobium daqui]RAL27075.1 hypothetical protein DL897_03310 [Thermoflavimicrobium daqui]
MKKYHYSSFGNNVIPFDIHQSPVPAQKTYPNIESQLLVIHEEQAEPMQQVSSQIRKRYKNSLNKKRLIKIWEKNRSQVCIAPMLPSIIEKLIYQNVYEDIKSLIFTCYHEDFDLPFVELTLFSWFEQLKATAKELNKEWDAVYWQEIIDFFKQCKKFELLDFTESESSSSAK